MLLDFTHCPQCDFIGGLHIEQKLVAKALGTWSLSGSQLKTPAQMHPFLECTNCDLSLQGNYADDGTSAVFRPAT